MMYGENSGTDETVKRIPEGSVGVEIGVWKGQSSKKFLKRVEHLHLVDPWSIRAYKNDSGEFTERGQTYFRRYAKLVGSQKPEAFQSYYEKIYNEVKEKFKNQPVTIHRCTSDEFFKKFEEKVDWIYIDGLHDYEGCLKDLRNALTIVKHDYGNKPGIVRAVDQFIAETNLPFDNFFTNQFEIKV
jgi:hypothetical protein